MVSQEIWKFLGELFIIVIFDVLFDPMKKIVLSLSVFVVFAMYVVTTLSRGEFSIVPSVATTTNTTQSITQHIVYKDGQYTGDVVDAYYGNVQVQTTVQAGKISDVMFVDYPHDRSNSVRINTVATPMLKSEAIQVQSSQVDTISGATFTSNAFRQSLASALAQATM